MNEESRFNELLQSRLSERDFPFDELNWDEAEKQIIKQENRRKRNRFGFIFASGLLAGMGIMWLLVRQPALQHQTETAAISGNTNTTISGQTHTTISGQTLMSAPTVMNEKTNVNTIPDNGNKFAPVKAHQGTNETGLVQSQNPKKANSHQLIANSFGGGLGQTSIQSLSISAQAGSEVGLGLTANNEPVQENSVPSENISQRDPFGQTLPHQPFELTYVTNNPADTEKKGGFLAGFWYLAIDSTTSKSSAPLAWRDTNKPDFALLRVSCATHIGSGFKPLNSVFIDGGVNYSSGWNNNELKEGKGTTPIIGICFNHYFSDKFSASAGIQPQMLNGLDKSYTTSVVQYDFGATATITTLTPKTLYYIGVPLKANYNITDKSLIGIGMDFLFLLNTSSSEATYNYTYFGTTTNYTSATKLGYMDGFNAADMQFSIAYTRMLMENLGISVELYWGMLDIETSGYFGSNQNIKNNGGRIVLSYRIFK